MKASDLRQGHVITCCPDEDFLQGWTVERSSLSDDNDPNGSPVEIVILSLSFYDCEHRYLPAYGGICAVCKPDYRTAWLRADAEVEAGDE